MNPQAAIIEAIANVLSQEKSYNLPVICTKYGLDQGEVSEAHKSKAIYVKNRLVGKEPLFVIDVAKRVAMDYEAVELFKLLDKLSPSGFHEISQITRKNIFRELNNERRLEGDIDLLDFLHRTWDLDRMPSSDPRYSNARGDIIQHFYNNSDWEYDEIFEKVLSLYNISDKQFLHFLEQVVHPSVRAADAVVCLDIINKHLVADGYELKESDHISGYPIFTATHKEDGVRGDFKNLIFAAVGVKPEIVIDDAISNRIRITNDSECLIYDEPLRSQLLWNELIEWWSRKQQLEDRQLAEKNLYKRLFKSFDSEPERMFFHAYFQLYRNGLNENFPALIPQVYLHYDPYTAKKYRDQVRPLFRQRMDFLLLLKNNVRIVIEIDGKQHYSIEEKSSPKLYADMVKADRELRLNNYEVYRFGGQEFIDTKIEDLVGNFFHMLFRKHHIIEG